MFCHEQPKWHQNPWFTPLSEITSIPELFIWEFPGNQVKILYSDTVPLYCYPKPNDRKWSLLAIASAANPKLSCPVPSVHLNEKQKQLSISCPVLNYSTITKVFTWKRMFGWDLDVIKLLAKSLWATDVSNLLKKKHQKPTTERSCQLSPPQRPLLYCFDLRW